MANVSVTPVIQCAMNPKEALEVVDALEGSTDMEEFRAALLAAIERFAPELLEPAIVPAADDGETDGNTKPSGKTR